MEQQKDVIGYVAGKMNISRTRAAGFLGMANEAIEEVLDRKHTTDYSHDGVAIAEDLLDVMHAIQEFQCVFGILCSGP